MKNSDIKRRLRIAAGQLDKVNSMIEADEDVSHILQQLIAARSAVKAVHCVFVARKLGQSGKQGGSSDELEFLIKNLGKI